MAFTTDTWVLHKDWDRATITFQITNFAAAVAAKKKGQCIDSKLCTIGGTQFGVCVFPLGDMYIAKAVHKHPLPAHTCDTKAAANHLSIYTDNNSDHRVSCDYTITVGDKKMSSSNQQIKGNNGMGWRDFMERKEVGANLTVVVDITLLREEVGGADRGVIGRTFLKETVKEVLESVNTEQADNHADLKSDLEELKTDMRKMKQEMALARGPIKIPECVICLDELRPPLRIVQCLKGHKLCEPCSLKEEVVSCPLNCRSGFMGRDLGMEGFVRQLLGE